MTVARGKLAAQLGCRSGRRWLHLGCLRTMANESRPLCWTDIFVDGRFAAIVRAQDAFRSAVFGLIEKEAGENVVEIQQEIRAVILVNREALRIAAAPGSPALEITRRYFSTGRRLIQVSVNTIPADRFFYSVEILRVAAAPSRLHFDGPGMRASRQFAQIVNGNCTVVGLHASGAWRRAVLRRPAIDQLVRSNTSSSGYSTLPRCRGSGKSLK
jgi:UTRA domain